MKPVEPSLLLDTIMILMEQDMSSRNETKLITQHSIKEIKGHIQQDKRLKPNSKSPRILLAEDNLVNQKVASKLLQNMHCMVDIAANGAEAVTMVKQFPYDLIFMDCQMPEMDGYAATRLIKEFLHDKDISIPIIAMTANALKGDRETCLAAGMDDYISKPIDREKLQKIIIAWSQPTQKEAV